MAKRTVYKFKNRLEDSKTLSYAAGIDGNLKINQIVITFSNHEVIVIVHYKFRSKSQNLNK